MRQRPAFVGVDDEFGVRRAGAHCPDALKIAVGAELDLEQRPVCVFGRLLAHRRRRAERNRVGGRRGPRLGEARQSPGRRSRPFRFEVPKGAVERVARRPGRQSVLQRDAIESVVEVDRDGTDERDHALRRLAVARIGNALAAPHKSLLGQRRRHDADFRARPARDREGAGDGKTLFGDAELNRHHHASNAAARRTAPRPNGSTMDSSVRFSTWIYADGDRIRIPIFGRPGRCGVLTSSGRARRFYDEGLATLAHFGGERRESRSPAAPPSFRGGRRLDQVGETSRDLGRSAAGTLFRPVSLSRRVAADLPHVSARSHPRGWLIRFPSSLPLGDALGDTSG